MRGLPIFMVLLFAAFLIDNPWFAARWVNEYQSHREGGHCP